MAHEHTVLTPEQAEIAVDYVRHKTAHATLVSKNITDEGSFVGYASTFGDVFDHPDLQGDIVDRHAFDRTLERWRQRGNWPPLLYNHDTSVAGTMGVIKNLYVDGTGLVLEGRLDLSHPPAEALYEAMKAKRITGLSIAYAILLEERQRDGTNLLLDLELIEISVTPVPANQDAQIMSVKNANSWNSGSAPNWTPTPPTSKAGQMIADARTKIGNDPEARKALDRLAAVGYADRNAWMLEEFIADVLGAHELRTINDRLDAIEHDQRPRDAVDAFVTSVRQEMVEEKLAEARASSFDAELNERAAHTGPIPEFDERFAVTSVPTEYESGETEPEQVVGYESETFRVAVFPGTMRPENE